MMKDEKTYRIIGCAMEVHKELGCGFLEAVYQEALGREFKGQEIPFKSQPTIQIFYKGRPLDKTYQPDFVCFDEVIVEIKALAELTGIEEAQLIMGNGGRWCFCCFNCQPLSNLHAKV